MPVTYNGIGTHYYGKRNLETRTGVCQACGREGALRSYDTRLWFVVFYIPIVPLGRKRIINDCPSCRRHYAADKHKWETMKQLEVSGAQEKFRSNPTPETAIEVHQALLNFQQMEEAAEFRQTMRTQFPENAKVHAYLGVVLQTLGRTEESLSMFTKALSLRPDMPEARIGMAHCYIRSKNFAEARALLDFLEKPGAQLLYSLEPLEILALAMQKEGKHEEALDLFSKLIAALPRITDHKGFRTNVLKSEKALKRTPSLLPKRKFSWKRLLRGDGTPPAPGQTQVTWRGVAWGGAVAAVILLMFVFRNEYVRRHRTLHVVNDLPQPATMEIDGTGPKPVGKGHTELTLGEGQHHVKIAGPVSEEFDIVMRTGFFDRWADDPLWVINPGGASVLVHTLATYTSQPRPARVTFHFGKTFEFFPDVAYAFRDLPKSLQLKSGESRTLFGVELLRGTKMGLFQHLQSRNQSSEALRLAETTLRNAPDESDLLFAYVRAASQEQGEDRAKEFLKPRLKERPVRIDWHRAYQSLDKSEKASTRLAEDYDTLLTSEPENSALLYLRGRVTASRDESRRFYQRSAVADPTNPYPLFAQGFDHSMRGDWLTAKGFLEKALALRPNDASFSYYLTRMRFALGEFKALETDLHEQLRRAPASLDAAVPLCEALVAAGKLDEAQQVLERYQVAARNRFGESSRGYVDHLRYRLLYASANFTELQSVSSDNSTPDGKFALFQACLEQGKVDEALKAFDPREDHPREDKAFTALLVALVQDSKGRTKESIEWRRQALEFMESNSKDWVYAAQLLRQETAPTTSEIENMQLEAPSRSLVLASLAQKHPADRVRFSSEARLFNFGRGFPYHLVERITAP